MRPWLTEAEAARIEAAVGNAERGTTAEIVVVVTGEAVGSHWLLWPAFVALALPLFVLLACPGVAAGYLYALQLAVLAMGLLLGFVPLLRRLLVPVASRRMAARRCARDQFFERGLHLTAARTGILLLVSPVDRYAEIVADAGAHGPLPEDIWRPCVETLVAEVPRGQLAVGIELALGRLGDILRKRLPAAPEEPNEIPDRPVQL